MFKKQKNKKKQKKKNNSNQPAHSRSLIRVFVVHTKKLCIRGYSKCTQWIFWPDCAIRAVWSKSSLGAHVRRYAFWRYGLFVNRNQRRIAILVFRVGTNHLKSGRAGLLGYLIWIALCSKRRFERHNRLTLNVSSITFHSWAEHQRNALCRQIVKQVFVVLFVWFGLLRPHQHFYGHVEPVS